VRRDTVADAPPAEPVPLTDRQAEVFQVIERVYEATGEPVSASYLARRLDVHHEAIRGHLAALHRKHWLAGETSPATPIRRWLDR
jgi:predicted ArsR family transcriptional regulator